MKSDERARTNAGSWCLNCCSRHDLDSHCPGELPATGPERHVWRALAQTPRGVEAYGVLVAPSHEVWRARVLTYPNVLWLVPGGTTSIKFVGRTSTEAERRAVAFVHDHCRLCSYPLRDDCASLPGRRPTAASTGGGRQGSARKVRFLPVRFGLAGPTEPAGTGNLSEQGMFIITDTPVDPGTRLHVALTTPERTLKLEAEVRWMRRHHHVGRSPGMGLCITSPPPDYINYVRALG